MRYQITADNIQNVLQILAIGMDRRLREKGDGAFVSSHEAMGVITEEYKEAWEAVHANDHQHLRKELMDIAVGCLVGIISVDSGKLEF